MNETQMIDLHDDLSSLVEQQHLIAQMSDFSNRYGPARWSDDHGINLLIQRHEESLRLSA